MEKICKIVCFDEESVTDYVQIVAGGAMQNTTELLKEKGKQSDVNAEADGKLGINKFLKTLIGLDAEVGVKGSLDIMFNREELVRNIVKNTLLTDFLVAIDEDENKNKPVSRLPKGTVKKFKGYNISVEKDSLSYIAMLSPYLNMMNSKLPAGEFDIVVDKFDSVLRHAKGYYEFIGKKGRSKVIFRFNINSFRNSYKISDLLKMDLSIYAIKVGKTTIENLNINRELDADIQIYIKDNPSYGVEGTYESETNEFLDVFDVLLAGVEAHE